MLERWFALTLLLVLTKTPAPIGRGSKINSMRGILFGVYATVHMNRNKSSMSHWRGNIQAACNKFHGNIATVINRQESGTSMETQVWIQTCEICYFAFHIFVLFLYLLFCLFTCCSSSKLYGCFEIRTRRKSSPSCIASPRSKTARSGSKYNSLSMQNRELTMMMQCWPPTASRSVGWMATKKPRSQEGRVDHRGIIGRGGWRAPQDVGRDLLKQQGA
jgi:hypothetical protein